jgi:hypothetical protein
MNYKYDFDDVGNGGMTIEQKKACVNALYYFLLKSAHGHPEVEGFTLITKIKQYLNIELRLSFPDLNELMDDLQTITETRKKWLISVIISVVLTNGEIKDSISEGILSLAIDLGFSLDDAYELIMSHESEIDLLLPKNNSILEHEDSFRNQLTNLQKKSILGCFMLLISTSENEDHREMDYLQKITSLLGVDVTSFYFSTLLNEDELIQALNTLPKPKKEWLLFSLHLLVMIKGSADLDKVPFLMGIANDIGFSQYELTDVIKKYEEKLN